MKQFRTIMIGEEEYRFRYFYDHLDFSNYPFSYLIICPCKNPKNEIRIIFHKLEPPMLLPGSKGEPVSRNGVECFLNLNEPKYIREIIDYLLDGVVHFGLQDKWVFDEGEELLKQLGYNFEDMTFEVGDVYEK